jgi:FtsH-binding integral membrane protein
MSNFDQSLNWSQSVEKDDARQKLLFKFFNAVYAWMFVGLAVTAVVGIAMSQSHTALKMVYGNGRIGIILLALGAFVIANLAEKVALQVNAALGTVLFLIYAALIGVMTSAIFLVYPHSTLAAAFFVTAGTFAVMSVIGMVTKMDLTRMGGILTMLAIGLFIGSLANVFIASDALSWLITYAVVVVFVGLTAYYTQHLKAMALQFDGNAVMLGRLSVVGSLLLYVAFINIFFSILRIMGNRR